MVRNISRMELVLGVLVVGLAVAYVVRDAKALQATGGEGSPAASVERGRYLVTAMGCADCHAPKTIGPRGPVIDPTRFLSGHPAETALPSPPATQDTPWGVVTTLDLTAWSGPWGMSFAANLTPDATTGLGAWSEDNFVATLKTGRKLGIGRPLLPPMPVEQIGQLSEPDLRAIFRYLKTLTPVRNAVPEPVLAAVTAAPATQE